MYKISGAGLAIALLAFTLAGCHEGRTSGRASNTPASSASSPRTIAAATTTGQAATAANATPAAVQSPSKLTPELAAMAKQVQAAPGGSAARALSNRRIHVNAQGQIQVYVFVDHVDGAMQNSLSHAGARVELGEASMKIYQVWASPAALARISQLPGVVRITPPAYGFPK